MADVIEGMFRRFMARQGIPGFFNQLSGDAKQKLAEVENKYAELRISGPEGGVFYFQYKRDQLLMLDERPDIPYEKLDKFLLDGDMENYPSGDEVFFDVIDGELSPRAALARKYFRANTDRIIYDSEEFAQAFENAIDLMRVVLGVRKLLK